MNKEKVYIGVYKDSNLESLFYQKNKDTYYDMNDMKQSVSSNDLVKESLVPYNDIIKCKSSSRINVIKLYCLDRMENLSLNRVFIGNVYELEGVAITKKFNFSNERLNVSYKGTGDNKLIKENALLLSTEFCDGFSDMVDLIDLETGIMYDGDVLLKSGIQYVPRTEQTFFNVKDVIDIEENVIEKKKLLEKYREYKRR